MSIEIILNDAKIFGFGIGTIDQPPNTLGIIEPGVPLRHFHMAPPGQRLKHEEHRLNKSEWSHLFTSRTEQKFRRSNQTVRPFKLSQCLSHLI